MGNLGLIVLGLRTTIKKFLCISLLESVGSKVLSFYNSDSFHYSCMRFTMAINDTNGTNGTNEHANGHTNGTEIDLRKLVLDLQTTVRHLQSELAKVQDSQAIVALLNRYTALHDEACYDLSKRQQWENLFAVDGVAIYPYGKHEGRKGMGSWAFGGVSYFEQCQLLSSNFDVTYASEERQEAFVRTNCIAQWMKKREVFSEHFDEGGFYNWTLKKEDGVWRIAKVHLTITWTTGEDPTGVGPKTVSI